VPIEFAALDHPSGDNLFLRDRVLYGVRTRYGIGYGLWQTAFAGIA
jgi:phage major head subunit gpT-like protein